MLAEVEFKLLEQMAKNKIRVVKDLADKANVHQNVLYSVLNGRKKSLRFETIAKLCIALDCEVGELIEVKRK